MPDSPGPGRVLIAPDDGPLVWEPTWERIDNLTNCRCNGFDATVGRASEFDVTETGHAQVAFRDRNKTLNDPALVGKQIMLQIRNPVTDVWVPRWRGHIEEPNLDVHPSGIKADVTLDCVGIFDYLGGCEMQLEAFGDDPPRGQEGMVFFEDGPVETRLTQLFDNALLDALMYVVFTGNIDVLESQYGVGEPVLNALRDACDAEFPGIANLYEDRFGRAVFHGRYARFDPDTISGDAGDEAWDFTRWYAATMEDVTSGVAQLREIGYAIPRSRVINSYSAWPRGIRERDKPAQQRIDVASRNTYGFHGKTAPDLIIKRNTTTDISGVADTQLMSEFFVANYGTARKNIERVTFKAVRPENNTNNRAADIWDLMTRIDISDMLHLTVDEADYANEPHYVEGLQIQCRPAGGDDYDYVEVTPNLSPFAYYTAGFDPS
jgi:hypothetical protein